MTFRRITPKGQARAFVDKQMALKRKALINNYIMVGEKALEVARTQHKYKRRTGNLTSSIGYCIIDNGKVLTMSKFEVVGNGKDGAKEGRKFLRQLIKENSTGLVFIMVAGMKYAAYVEAMSLDVLESAELISRRMLPKMCKALNL